MTDCTACGAPLERATNERSRLAGDLLEYCACLRHCGSTTTVKVEACVHGRAQMPEGGGPCVCLDCGWRWTQHGATTLNEFNWRFSAMSGVMPR